MILPNLKLPSRINQCWEFSGIDHLDACLDKKHFESYPHAVTYCYNSRGFRDHEWPDSESELKNAIWCIGDSFTVGLGSPQEHTWTFCLGKITRHRVINVSMDGASNEWIARTAEKIIQAVNPAHLAIMWSYTHRRENNNAALDDEQRRWGSLRSASVDDDWQNFLQCKSRIDSIAGNNVQFSIPDFHNLIDVTTSWNAIQGHDWPPAPRDLDELNSVPSYILTEIDELHNCLAELQQALIASTMTINVKRKDLARDGHHFDLITAEWVASQAAAALGFPTNSKS